MKSNSNGFTLLELVVVLVLLGILSSLVFVNVGTSAAKKKRKLFARELVGLCHKARRIAAGRGVISTVYISSDQRRCWIDQEEPLTIPVEMRIEGEGILELGQGIFGIRFFPDGSSSGGSLFLSAGNTVLYAFHVDVVTGLLSDIKKEE